MKIIAIDPGTKESAYVSWNGRVILDMDILDNDIILELIKSYKYLKGFTLVIEQVRCYGMVVGASTLDTVFWSGRFCEAWKGGDGSWSLMPRMDVKMHLCHDSRAKDKNIRQALIDRFEPHLKPRQRPKAVLKGVGTHLWAAMALAVTWWDLNNKKEGV